MNRFIEHSPVVTTNTYNTSTIGCSLNEFNDLSLYEAKSKSVIP
jgi:hypothetical protein